MTSSHAALHSGTSTAIQDTTEMSRSTTSARHASDIFSDQAQLYGTIHARGCRSTFISARITVSKFKIRDIGSHKSKVHSSVLRHIRTPLFTSFPHRCLWKRWSWGRQTLDTAQTSRKHSENFRSNILSHVQFQFQFQSDFELIWRMRFLHCNVVT